MDSLFTQFSVNESWVDFLYPILTKQIAHRAERQVQDMYNNNFMEEPIVIGIDHGFSLIKTSTAVSK